MASAVDHCNTALAHLGDIANISSIDPPDQSAQARHCARFFPAAVRQAQEMHPWNFNTRRTELALIDPVPDPNVINQWAYVYAIPNGCLNALKVLDVNTQDDWMLGATTDQLSYWNPLPTLNNMRVDVPYVRETLADGTEVILTNQADALLMHTVLVTDTSKFTGLFGMYLEYFLAAKLAGPILKGTEGRAVAKEMMSMALAVLSKASMMDSNNRSISQIQQSVPWISMR